ncbi:PKD domain-containing protein [Puia sp. P3]|uniref:PKD domain-containing protein n=1 Tax=Puia sp. P3 TaxID=3423952 RepID=UPI003D67A8E0
MKIVTFALLSVLLISAACGKKSAEGPSDTAPSGLTVQTKVNADSSGNVIFTAAATNAVSYDFDFGNGVFQTVPGGVVTYKYPASGNYSVNVIAKSAAGLTASQSVQVTVIVKSSVVWADEFDVPGSPDASKLGL